MTSARRAADRDDGIRGAICAAAYGDALGSAYEFVSSGAIERRLGEAFATACRPAMPGSLLHPRAAGVPTDDTAMALSVAATIADGETPTAERFAQNFLRDLEPERPLGAMFWGGGPGGATTRALSRLRRGADARNNGDSGDGGNGAAMRAHPVGCLRDRDEALHVAAVQARVTHGHPAAIAAAQAVAVLVFDGLAGVRPSSDAPAGVADAQFAGAWNAAHRNLTKGDRLPAHLRDADMSGWGTVATAHAIALLYDDEPARAIGAAAASGGDTDTVATIVGALVGARHGWRRLAPVCVFHADALALCDRAVGALVSAL